jgi:DNA-binding response OmpR family regulator
MPRRKQDKTILVVDDDPVDRAAMQSALAAEGYTVLEAADYWQALRTYEQYHGKVAMLLTAIALPGNNGYELAQSLSTIDPALKVLFVSGLTGTEVSRFYNMPVSGPHLIDKPVQMRELVARVNRAFRSRVRELRVQHAG